jgi:hypothetical protein
VVVALLVAALFGQALAGLAEFNNQLLGQGLEQIGFWRSVTSSDFAEGVAENWQSDFLADFPGRFPGRGQHGGGLDLPA